MLKCFKTSF